MGGGNGKPGGFVKKQREDLEKGGFTGQARIEQSDANRVLDPQEAAKQPGKEHVAKTGPVGDASVEEKMRVGAEKIIGIDKTHGEIQKKVLDALDVAILSDETHKLEELVGPAKADKLQDMYHKAKVEFNSQTLPIEQRMMNLEKALGEISDYCEKKAKPHSTIKLIGNVLAKACKVVGAKKDIMFAKDEEAKGKAQAKLIDAKRSLSQSMEELGGNKKIIAQNMGTIKGLVGIGLEITTGHHAKHQEKRVALSKPSKLR